MARTLKSTGIAAKAQFVCAVDSDSGPALSDIKIYKSVSSSYETGDDLAAADNTSAVQSTRTVDSSVGIGTTTWNGHAVSYFEPVVSGAVQGVRFVTNFPWLTANKGSGTRALIIGVCKDAQSGVDTDDSRMFSNSSGDYPKVQIYPAANPLRVYRGDGGSVISYSGGASARTAGEDFTFAFTANASGTGNVGYFGLEGATITGPENTGLGSGDQFSNSVTQLGISTDTGGGNYWWHTKIILIAVITDDYADAAARTAAVQAVHADPYGEFFEAASSGGLLIPRGLSGGIQNLTGGIDG